jgi:hypothetical protein
MDWGDLADLTASVAIADQLRLEHIPAGSNRDDEKCRWRRRQPGLPVPQDRPPCATEMGTGRRMPGTETEARMTLRKSWIAF